jgi:XisI protein
MERIKKYQAILIKLLQESVQEFPSEPQSEVEEHLILDTQRHYFQWLTIGWEPDEVFKSYINVHFVIKPSGKIWLMENNTEIRFAEELVKRGVPRHDIVLGFQPPSVRAYTDYAAA